MELQMKNSTSICFLLLALCSAPAYAQTVSRGIALDYDVDPTGLSPAFPASFSCEPIASPFGADERFDGSTRRGDRNAGKHGGMDISLAIGTPVRAMASGRVIAKGVGGYLEGIYLWMLHTPSDSGLPFSSVVKFQHLNELPTLQIGERVTTGQVVAHSGLTGTTGGRAFGPNGYPHLHVSLFVADSFPVSPETGEVRVPPRSGRLSDPLLLFIPPSADLNGIGRLSAEMKKFPVAAVGSDGQQLGAATKVVWPVACKR